MATVRYGKEVSLEVKKSPTTQKKNKRYGLGYPFIPGSNGYVSKSTGTSLAKNNLAQLLKTSKGERVMLPDYGTELKKYLFEQLDLEVANEIRDHILITISTFMPEVEVLKFGIFETNEVNYTGLQGFVIRLTVRLKETNEQFNVQETIV